MQYEELVKLIDKLDQSSLAYFEFTNDNERLLLAKEVPQVAGPAPVVVTDVTESAALTAQLAWRPQPLWRHLKW